MMLIGFIYCVVRAHGQCKAIEGKSDLRTQHLAHSGEVGVSFKNGGNATLEILWISESGVESSMGMLEPNSETSYTSYTGHAFRVRVLATSDTIYEVIVSKPTGEVSYVVGVGCSDATDVVAGSNVSFDSYKFSSLRTFRLIPDPQVVKQALASSPCSSVGIADWISRKVAVPGYHVLCLSHAKELPEGEGGGWAVELEAWREGFNALNQRTGQTFAGARYHPAA